MRPLATCLLCLATLASGSGLASAGETVVAARTIPARSIIDESDLKLISGTTPGALRGVSTAIGLEARVTLYQGRPVRQQDLGPPAIVERNQIVSLLYENGGLTILAEGRALDRAGHGDRVRVMNLASRTTITGTVTGQGEITVP